MLRACKFSAVFGTLSANGFKEVAAQGPAVHSNVKEHSGVDRLWVIQVTLGQQCLQGPDISDYPHMLGFYSSLFSFIQYMS